MTNLQKEAIEAAEKLNTKLSKDTHKFVVFISNQSAGIALNIHWEESQIQISMYDSTFDDRIFYPKLNREEKLTALLKRKFREIKKDLNKIKI
jgi:hypothetical protein